MYLISYTPGRLTITLDVSMFTVDKILVVTLGSLNTPPRGILTTASPFNVIVGIVGSFVMTILLVFVTLDPKPFCDVYVISYS